MDRAHTLPLILRTGVDNTPVWRNNPVRLFFAKPSWTVEITGTDVNGNDDSTMVTVTVPNVPPVFNSGVRNQIAAVGQAFSFTQPGATDANGDPINYSSAWSDGTAFPSWLHFNASTLTWSGGTVSRKLPYQLLGT